MEYSLDGFRKSLIDDKIIKHGDKILVALSGGPDSVFLLRMLRMLRDEFELEISAFHLNHCIRQTAQRDEDFCVSLCDDLDIPIDIFKTNITEKAFNEHISLEQAGRDKRYEIMESYRGKVTLVVTAHHMDDNVETVIMHLIRGTGIEGLCGIPLLKDGFIYRPLLNYRKEDIVSFLDSNKYEYVIDETNSSDNYFRNRIRNLIIPILENENPNFKKGVCHLSSIACDYEKEIDRISSAIHLDIAGQNSVCVNYEDIMCNSDLVIYKVLKRMLDSIGKGRDVSYNSIKDVIGMIHDGSKTVWSYDVAHAVIKRSYGIMVCESERSAQGLSEFSYTLPVPGCICLARERIIIKCFEVSKDDFSKRDKADEHCCYISMDNINEKLTVRNRKEGDVFRKIGAPGGKKVNRLFIDRKVPDELRDKIPIIESNDDIVCILGFGADERYKVTDKTERILKITMI